MGTKIMKCTCEDTYQDQQYGKGNRVHNVGGKKNDTAYCTVCSPSKFRTLRHYPTVEPMPIFGTFPGIFGPTGAISLKGKPHPGGKDAK